MAETRPGEIGFAGLSTLSENHVCFSGGGWKSKRNNWSSSVKFCSCGHLLIGWEELLNGGDSDEVTDPVSEWFEKVLGVQFHQNLLLTRWSHYLLEEKDPKAKMIVTSIDLIDTMRLEGTRRTFYLAPKGWIKTLKRSQCPNKYWNPVQHAFQPMLALC